MACCRAPQFRLCIKQGDDGSFYLRDSEAVNFSDAAEVKFVVRNRSTDAELIRYTLSGGEIILPADNVLSFEIPSATSRTLPKGRHWAEAWVTTSLGKEVSARGWLDVQDMKEFDE